MIIEYITINITTIYYCKHYFIEILRYNKNYFHYLSPHILSNATVSGMVA